MIKYASNSFLALKISYINEIANLCETLGADIHDVASAMGQDGRIKDKIIAVLGLSFKANTDDVRESSSINMIEFILSKGGIVRAYDPIANVSMSKLFDNISYFDDVYDAVKGADALVVMTEWNEFRALDLPRIKKIMRSAFILDTRNIINMSELSKLGFVYDNIGRIKI